VLVDILGKKNFKQIKEISNIYKTKYNKDDLVNAIKKNTQGNLSKALRAIGRNLLRTVANFNFI